MKVPKIAEEEAPVDPRIPMKEQLKTDEGDLENLLDNENLVFSQWIKNFTNVAVFRFPDLFNYLVGKDPIYNSESPKSEIGHVSGHCWVQFVNSGLFRSMFSVEFERKEEEQRTIYLANDMKEMTRRWVFALYGRVFRLAGSCFLMTFCSVSNLSSIMECMFLGYFKSQ